MMSEVEIEQLVGQTITTSGFTYEVEQILGIGGFAAIAKCKKQPANITVAVKINLNQRNHYKAVEEKEVMKKLQVLGSRNVNIVHWLGCFRFNRHFCLELEMLDISLWDYRAIHTFDLKDIRPIVQQVATALKFLKEKGYVHADLKTDNIMMVDHINNLLKVKVIDFGMATNNPDKYAGGICGTLPYIAPEILLGTPISAAIDVWALGCIAAEICADQLLFPGDDVEEMVKLILQTLGMPPTHLIRAGSFSGHYFTRRRQKKKPWTTKPNITTDVDYDLVCPISTLKEFLGRSYKSEDVDSEAEDCDLAAFVDLLDQMLKIDPGQRITPEGILSHPFITMSHIGNMDDSYFSSSVEQMKACRPPGSKRDSNKAHCSTADTSQAAKAAKRNRSKPQDGTMKERLSSEPEDETNKKRKRSETRDENPTKRKRSEPQDGTNKKRKRSETRDENPTKRKRSYPEDERTKKGKSSDPQDEVKMTSTGRTKRSHSMDNVGEALRNTQEEASFLLPPHHSGKRERTGVKEMDVDRVPSTLPPITAGTSLDTKCTVHDTGLGREPNGTERGAGGSQAATAMDLEIPETSGTQKRKRSNPQDEMAEKRKKTEPQDTSREKTSTWQKKNKAKKKDKQ